jgi:hypothetical protein
VLVTASVSTPVAGTTEVTPERPLGVNYNSKDVLMLQAGRHHAQPHHRSISEQELDQQWYRLTDYFVIALVLSVDAAIAVTGQLAFVLASLPLTVACVVTALADLKQRRPKQQA